ncbi:RDD family protein [Solirubrobacter ginsenosidimutans]|uniref:RDD family protein n=1 Tax=Solirubrobacter ginsenosidimutans TaxID=490573 RepID=A0A9X3N2N8_9ACTN|nr:RDD family protein [Solirubrobacter ginsenosidimutans]MDA0167409.1 RDD family protein [Solirubrobacter ginsenosidimutans]
MTRPSGDYLPPSHTATAANAAVSQDPAAHEAAAARAQAAAAARVHVQTGTNEHAAADYTGLVTRAIAFAIDALIIDLAAIVVVAIVALALSLFNVPAKVETALAVIGAFLFVVWAAAYFVTFWSTTGQTPGARIMRFRVLAPGAQHGHIGPKRALIRLLGMVLAAIPLLAGYFMVLFDDRRRGLHDRLARTVAIDAPDTETPANRMRAQRQASRTTRSP